MDRLIAKYAAKLVDQKLADPDAPILGGRDADIVWNQKVPLTDLLEGVFDKLNINSLLYCRPASPYAEIIEFLADKYKNTIYPQDTETRTFLHDLPIAPSLTESVIVENLKRRKIVILPDGAIATCGSVSPEETFVFFSSVCFSCYVKFMSDCLLDHRAKKLTLRAQQILKLALDKLPVFPKDLPLKTNEAVKTEAEIYAAMDAAGKLLVKHKLVDSYFGNISFFNGGILHISQTGSSLDELAGHIDPCPINGNSSVGITASSELTAHLRILKKTGARAILHGHPKFAVVTSLDCEYRPCENDGRCHLTCPHARSVEGIPIVPGEVGRGRYGLCNTVPQAMIGHKGAIVYGHGVFTCAPDNFNAALKNMFEIEQLCRDNYIKKVM